MSRSGLPAQRQLDLARARAMCSCGGASVAPERQPAVAAQAPVPAQPVVLAGDDRVRGAQLADVGAEQLVAASAADQQLVVERGRKRFGFAVPGGGGGSSLGTRGPYRAGAARGRGGGGKARRLGRVGAAASAPDALVAFRRRGHAGGPARSLTDDRQSLTALDPTAFAIGFDQRDRARLHELWDEVLDSQRWTRGRAGRALRGRLGGPERARGVAFSSWAGAALAALEFCGVRGETVLCPSNTFMATPLSVLKAGGRAGVRRLQPRGPLRLVRGLRGARRSGTGRRAAWLVHIGGHIAFDVERIAAYCREQRDLPDRGLRPRPRRAAGAAAGRGPGATPASTRCTRPRRSRPARAACWSPRPR